MASRFAELDQQLATSAPTTCKLCLFLADAPKADAKFVAGMVADKSKASAHIARVLTAGGVDITETSVKRHRSRHLGQ